MRKIKLFRVFYWKVFQVRQVGIVIKTLVIKSVCTVAALFLRRRRCFWVNLHSCFLLRHITIVSSLHLILHLRRMPLGFLGLVHLVFVCTPYAFFVVFGSSAINRVSSTTKDADAALLTELVSVTSKVMELKVTSIQQCGKEVQRMFMCMFPLLTKSEIPAK